LDSLLRFRPRQRGLKGGDGVEELVGGRQGDLVNAILRRGDGTPVEGCNPARECVDEAVQLGVWKCPVDVSVSFRGVAVEIVPAENDFERPAAPPSAASNRPSRRWVAPVNAPFSWPKSSEAMRDSGIAAQLTRMNALLALGDRLCMARAINCLPVPVSPVMRTVESTRATRARARSA